MEPIDGPVLNFDPGTHGLLSYLKANDLDISLSSKNGNLIKNNLSSFYNSDGKIYSDNKSKTFKSKLLIQTIDMPIILILKVLETILKRFVLIL